MDWILLALVSVLIWAGNNILDKIFLEKFVKDIGAISIIVGFFSILVFFLLLPFSNLSQFEFKDALIAMLAGFLLIVSYVPYLKALSIDEASRVVPVYQTIPIFVLVISYVLLGESFGAKSLIGFFVVLFGTLLLSLDKFSFGFISFRKSFRYMILTSLIYAFAIVIFKFVAKDYDVVSTFCLEVLGSGLAGVAFWILIPKYRKEFNLALKNLPKKGFMVLAINEGTFLVGKLINAYALVLAPVALVSLVENTQPFFVLLYALFLSKFFPRILKEDFSKNSIKIKLVSLVIITVGTFLI